MKYGVFQFSTDYAIRIDDLAREAERIGQVLPRQRRVVKHDVVAARRHLDCTEQHLGAHDGHACAVDPDRLVTVESRDVIDSVNATGRVEASETSDFAYATEYIRPVDSPASFFSSVVLAVAEYGITVEPSLSVCCVTDDSSSAIAAGEVGAAAGGA